MASLENDPRFNFIRDLEYRQEVQQLPFKRPVDVRNIDREAFAWTAYAYESDGIYGMRAVTFNPHSRFPEIPITETFTVNYRPRDDKRPLNVVHEQMLGTDAIWIAEARYDRSGKLMRVETSLKHDPQPGELFSSKRDQRLVLVENGNLSQEEKDVPSIIVYKDSGRVIGKPIVSRLQPFPRQQEAVQYIVPTSFPLDLRFNNVTSSLEQRKFVLMEENGLAIAQISDRAVFKMK